MDYDLCQAFDLEGRKIITIEENGFIDGCFCVGAILQKIVANKEKVAFVLHHHGFGHFQGIGTKLGYNLHAMKEAGSVMVVNVMEEVRFG